MIDISTDKARLNVPVIHRFLSEESYWARHIPLEVVARSIANSLCFGVYDEGQQVGFARVVTDYATFGYLADVFILPSHRGQGLSKQLMASIMQHEALQGIRRMMLVTQDAHGLYRQFGFQPVDPPANTMSVKFFTAY
jgi:GNAT superfamily N-acetyltransferase